MSEVKEMYIVPKSNFDDISYATGFGMSYSEAKTKMAIFSNGVIGVGGAAVAGISSYLLETHKSDLPQKEKVALTVLTVLGGAAAAGGISGAITNAKALKEIKKVNDNLEKALSELDNASDADEAIKAIARSITKPEK